jgi:peroxiredoxin
MKATDRIRPGTRIAPRELTTVRSECIRIPDPRQLVHLQFRRFAGCPVCDLHLHSFARRRKEIAAASIQEVVVFHSTPQTLLPHAGDLPFRIIADPEKKLYAEFGVESSPRALLDPRVWRPVVLGVIRSLVEVIRRRQPFPSVKPKGGRFGLPADFLIASDGRVVACKYGTHAYDQWSVGEVLLIAKSELPDREMWKLTRKVSHSEV